ncbi:kinase-like domain-containing protein [Syncephalis plumigaleata]|nr:kinase-like domain-containing protein [Syncephalis plumigaleata]
MMHVYSIILALLFNSMVAAKFVRLGSTRSNVELPVLRKEPFGRNDFVITEIIGGDKHMAVGEVIYRRKRSAIIKCVDNKLLIKNELRMFEVLKKASLATNINSNGQEYIVKPILGFSTKKEHCILMEHGGTYNIAEYAEQLDVIDKGDILHYLFVQVLHGLAYLHRLKIAHGDICPENIMVRKVKGEPYPRVTIIDLSSSTQVVSQFNIFRKKMYIRGTKEFLSPEAFMEKKVDLYQQDSWGVGASIYYALTGRYVFQEILSFAADYPFHYLFLAEMKKIRNGQVTVPTSVTRNRSVREKWSDIIRMKDQFLVIDPANRATPKGYLKSL